MEDLIVCPMCGDDDIEIVVATDDEPKWYKPKCSQCGWETVGQFCSVAQAEAHLRQYGQEEDESIEDERDNLLCAVDDLERENRILKLRIRNALSCLGNMDYDAVNAYLRGDWDKSLELEAP